MIWEAIKRLVEHEGHVVEATVWAFGVIIVSIVVDFFAPARCRTPRKRHQSHALEADALHFSSDLWSSLAVLIGLVCVYFGLTWADWPPRWWWRCCLLRRLAARQAAPSRRSIDVAPPGAADKITAIAAKVSGVVAVENVRARSVGEKTFIDLAVAVSRTLPLDRVSALKDQIAADISGQFPAPRRQSSRIRSLSTMRACLIA